MDDPVLVGDSFVRKENFEENFEYICESRKHNKTFNYVYIIVQGTSKFCLM